MHAAISMFGNMPSAKPTGARPRLHASWPGLSRPSRLVKLAHAAVLSLHARQPSGRCAVCWRHERPGSPCVGTQKQIGEGTHEHLQGRSFGLFRDSRDGLSGHSAREKYQALAARLEDTVDSEKNDTWRGLYDEISAP